MKKLLDWKRFRVYVVITLIFSIFLLISEYHKYPETFQERAVNTYWRLIFIVVLNYILFEFTFPYIGRKRKSIFRNILVAIPLLVVHLMLYSWGFYGWRSLGIGLDIYTSLKTFATPEEGAAEHMGFSMMSIVFFGISRHIFIYYQLRRSARLLRIEKQQAELNYLRSQTNPHFLFNTLNNIYSLSRDKSDKAPESILRLSKILRFMLYETGGNYIAVEQELKIIADYIELEKLRYDESLRVNFNYDVEEMKQAIPPLLLIPLVENAFKHGVSETRGNPFIDIHLSIKQRQLMLVVRNSSDGIPGEKIKENIGLGNLRRQLELLYEDYYLDVKQETGDFTAILKINLSSHV